MKIARCNCKPRCSAHEKECITCGEVKSLDRFYRHRMMLDGHLNKCMACVREYAQGRRMELLGDPEWVAVERECCREKERRRGQDPVEQKKRRARRQLRNRVYQGLITPPNTCEDCGEPFDEYRREAHHKNYDKPFDVTWLCQRCHIIRHAA